MKAIRLGLGLGSCGLIFFLVTIVTLLPGALGQRSAQKIVRYWSRFFLWLFRIRVCEHFYEDETPLPKRRVIVANHVSYIDIMVIFARQDCVFIAKKEVGSWPFIGFVARRLGMVLVDRDKLWDRARSLLELQTRLQQGHTVVIFPEGTTSMAGPRRGWTPFYPGAFRVARMEDAPIELLYLDYQAIERCAWVGDDTLLPHLYNLAAHPVNNVFIRKRVIDSTSDRRAQRHHHSLARSWMLSAGKNLSFLPQHSQLPPF